MSLDNVTSFFLMSLKNVTYKLLLGSPGPPGLLPWAPPGLHLGSSGLPPPAMAAHGRGTEATQVPMGGKPWGPLEGNHREPKGHGERAHGNPRVTGWGTLGSPRAKRRDGGGGGVDWGWGRAGLRGVGY